MVGIKRKTRVMTASAGVSRRKIRRLFHSSASHDEPPQPAAESDDEFIHRLYRTLLRREPDTMGLDTYALALRDGMPRENLAMVIADSPEYRELVARPPLPVRVVRHKYGRTSLSVCIADELGNAWYDLDYPTWPELSFLAQHRLRPGAVAFDVGAHQGVYALTIADYVQPGGSVVAVEANAFNAGLIELNRALNNVENLAVVHAAAAEHCRQIPFGGGGNGHVDISGGDAHSSMVIGITIDELAHVQRPPDVVIVDVEGYECRVLAGAMATLERDVDWHIEVHTGCGLEDYGGSVEGLLSFFPQDRFELFLSNELVRQPRRFSVALFEDVRRQHFYLTALKRQRAYSSGRSAGSISLRRPSMTATT